ncbi:hypothetical protein [Cohnella nanjingensis]|uniref:VCBS repeat-containing protein n=1 Tax=Cohnella nanjingensis TaxID=1387779 RepID=A0A7X0RNE6_9BACL|nr:hypothetical protein [Cohnella nanjingensis]MBB6670722.1 hypothetical protein [Cohnella nanjingensis]
MIKRLMGTGILVLALFAVGGCGVPVTPVELLGPPAQENDAADLTFLALLPEGARLLHPVRYGDVDGDGMNEAVIVYEENVHSKKAMKAALVKKQQEAWKIVWATNGFGYGLDYAGIHDTNGDGQPEILLGWSFGAGGNGLDIYEWTNQQWMLKDTRPYDGPLGSPLAL